MMLNIITECVIMFITEKLALVFLSGEVLFVKCIDNYIFFVFIAVNVLSLYIETMTTTGHWTKLDLHFC